MDITDLLNFAQRLLDENKLEESRKFHMEEANGETSENYMYAKAESARPGPYMGSAYVTFLGTEYGPKPITNGAFDDPQNESTVLVQLKSGLWYKLWFYDSDLEN